MKPRNEPRPARLVGAVLLYCLGVSALGCGDDAVKGADVDSIWREGSPLQKSADDTAPADDAAIHIAWFGHSLLRAPATKHAPELDIPAVVAQLHRLALADNRTAIPEGRSIGFSEGPNHLGYWLDGKGDARAKLQGLAEVPLRYVVGVGFMHLLGTRSYSYPSLTHHLSKVMPERFDSPRRHTLHKYRFMQLTRQLHPKATWVNYVGPALSNAKEPQPRINARFECIRRVAANAGLEIKNVPVGPAIRTAEERAKDHPELSIALQQPDFLHLTAQGGLLAGYVFYEALFGVSPKGLPVPDRYRDNLAPDHIDEVATFLQEVASDTLRDYRAPDCDESARLPEDAEGAALLR